MFHWSCLGFVGLRQTTPPALPGSLPGTARHKYVTNNTNTDTWTYTNTSQKLVENQFGNSSHILFVPYICFMKINLIFHEKITKRRKRRKRRTRRERRERRKRRKRRKGGKSYLRVIPGVIPE